MIYLIIGKTFSGKSTHQQRLAYQGITPVIQHTTRPPREGENDGIDYWFEDHLPDPRRKTVLMRQYKAYQGNICKLWSYWYDPDDLVSKAEVSLITDLQGVQDFQEQMPNQNAAIIYLATSYPTILNRINKSNRSGENLKETVRRLSDDAQKFEFLDNYARQPVRFGEDRNLFGLPIQIVN